MNQTDQKKVIDAGFTILRKQDLPTIIIKAKTIEDPDSWRTIGKFDTKAARDREFNKLLKNSKYIED